MTLEELSRRVGVDASYTCRVFSHKRVPPLDLAMKLAEVLGEAGEVTDVLDLLDRLGY